MTLDEARQATSEAAEAAVALSAHLARLRERLRPDFPLSALKLTAWDDQQRERLHALLRMFEQLYDLVGRKLLRGYLILSGEDTAAMSAKSAARRAETLAVLSSADEWLELGVTRNRLVHDYPVNAERQAAVANLTWDDIAGLLDATAQVVRQLKVEELI